MENKKVLMSDILNSWYGFYDLKLIDLHLKVGKELKCFLREELQIIFDSGDMVEFETALDFFLAVEEEVSNTIENTANRWSPAENTSVWLEKMIERARENERQMGKQKLWFNASSRLVWKKTPEDFDHYIDIRTLSSCLEIDEKIMKVLGATVIGDELVLVYENFKKKKPLTFEKLACEMGQSLKRIFQLVEILKTIIRKMIR